MKDPEVNLLSRPLDDLLSLFTLHKKWSFVLTISPLNVAKPTGNYGFGNIYWRHP